ncbi:MAG TPA: alanine racemase [Pseudomonadales bacterium]|nr:alanine racemase [Pseudomonadales bacterium]
MKTRAIIKLAAITHNLDTIRTLAPDNNVIAVVKADAYGHGVAGLLPILKTHTEALAIARIEEAQILRAAGYKGRMLLLCGVANPLEINEAQSLQLDILVHDITHLALLTSYSSQAQHKTTFWLKMDTGMHRLGFAPQEYAGAFHTIKKLPWCENIIGMTHFSSAEECDDQKTAQQIHCYQQHTAGLALDNHSLANSAGIIAWPEARRGWLRPGLMMYGINPVGNINADLQPAMQLEAQIIGMKTIAKGEPTGYNENWRAKRESRIAFIAAGYADGYPITALNKTFVAINGVRVPVIGRVSMDTTIIDCTDITAPTVGDWAELWGDTINVSEVANAAGSIPYQLLTSVSQRVTRIYQ